MSKQLSITAIAFRGASCEEEVTRIKVEQKK